MLSKKEIARRARLYRVTPAEFERRFVALRQAIEAKSATPAQRSARPAARSHTYTPQHCATVTVLSDATRDRLRRGRVDERRFVELRRAMRRA